MPDLTVPTAAPATVASPTNDSWLGNVPGGDLTFDELFATPESPAQPTTAPANATPVVQPTAQPSAQTPSPEDFFLKGAKSVYKTRDDAQKGLDSKDTLIEQLRNRYILERGVDPVTNQPVNISQNPQVPTNYLQDHARYGKDLAAAASKEDYEAYYNTQSKLIFDLLQPIAPIIQDFAKQRAVDSVSNEVKDFRAFRESEDYKNLMGSEKVLSEAINTAESDFRMHEQLPDLYKLAFWAAQGRKVPELIKAAQAQPAVAPAQPTRQTVGQSTLSPASGTVAESMSTSSGRQAIKARLEALGILDQKF